MGNTVIYVRTNSNSAEPEHYQEIMCKKYANENNLKVDKVIIDKGFSANNHMRPGLTKLLSNINDTENIIISDYARISRDYPYLLNFIKITQEKGITIHCVL